MTVEINPNPAMTITVDLTDTFSDYAKKLIDKSKRPLRHGNKDNPTLPGERIELKPGGNYAVTMWDLDAIATKEQFAALRPYIEQAIVNATLDGIIAPGWVKDFSTLFDLHPPEVPEQFQEEGYEINMFLSGETKFVVSKNPLPEVIVDDE